MRTERLGAFTDAVIAIAITIMVLELPKPEQATWEALRADLPVLLAYALSFAYLGTYWNNHHHMLAAVERVSGSVLWANLHLLFWLSLVPFTTEWMSDQDFAPVPTAAYGTLLLIDGVAYWILQSRLLRAEGPGSLLKRAIGRDAKGRVTPLLYLAGIALTFVDQWIGLGLYVVAALIWLVPDRRVERLMTAGKRGEESEAVDARR